MTDPVPGPPVPGPPVPGPPGPPAADDRRSEPLAGPGLIAAAATSIVALLSAYGFHVTKVQAAVITGAIGSCGALAVWLWGRRSTWSPNSVHRLLAARRQDRTVVDKPPPAGYTPPSRPIPPTSRQRGTS